MTDDAHTAVTPDIAALLAALPRKVVLDFVKADPLLARTVFQGFAARLQSLALPFIRDRLVRELEKNPEALAQLTETWQQLFAGLTAALSTEEFTPTLEHLTPLAAEFGREALRVALQRDDRDDMRAWADRVGEIPMTPRTAARPAAPPPAPLAPSTTALEAKVRELQAALQEAARAQDTARQEQAQLKRLLDTAAGTEAALQKQIETLQRTLDREQRRARKAEEDAERLEKQLRDLRQAITTEPLLTTRDAALVQEAITLLQRSLGTAPEAPPPPPPRKAEAPAAAPPAKPVKRTAAAPAIHLPGQRGKQAYTISNIITALLRNDVAVLDTIRDGLARLGADDPAREREVLATLAKAGVPGAVLTGPLRAAVVDGSNVANMSHAARGKLAYLEQVQRSAWEEGYFPVLIIVDASLRYQIDQPDQLMTLVEEGRIIMASPGTTADPLLIEEARRRNAVLISNDRMLDWPDAMSLERRKAAMSRDTVRVGSFHNDNSTSWFNGKRGKR